MSKQFDGTFDLAANFNVTLARPLDNRAVISNLGGLVVDSFENAAYDGMMVTVLNAGVFIMKSKDDFYAAIAAADAVPTNITDSVLDEYSWYQLQTTDLTTPLTIDSVEYSTIESYLTAVNSVVLDLVANSSGIMSINSKSDANIVLYSSDITMSSADSTTIQAYVEALSNKLTTAITYKGNADTFDDLPTDASQGDMYNVLDTDKNYVWNATGGDDGEGAWDDVGGLVDLSEYQKITDNSLTTTSKTVPGAINELDAEVATNTASIGTLNTTVAGHTTSIASLTTSLGNKADSSTVTTLAGRVTTNELDISTLERSVGDIESALEDVASADDLETLEGTVSDLSAQVSTNTSNITDKVGTSTFNSTVSTLEASISSLDNSKADADDVVTLTGDQTIEGSKTFVSSLKIEDTSAADAAGPSLIVGHTQTNTGGYNIVCGTANNNSGNRNIIGGTLNTVIYGNSIIAGNTNTTSGLNSIVCGNKNTNTPSSGGNSIVAGVQNSTTGIQSIICGYQNEISANDCVASGSDNEIESGANDCFIGGNNNIIKASSQNSGTLGRNNTIESGSTNSFIIGGYNTVSTDNPYSFAAGVSNTVSTRSGTALGEFNKSTNDNSIGYLLTVGNGTSDTNRSNALALDSSGNLEVNSVTMASVLSTLILKGSNTTLTIPAELANFKLYNVTKNIEYVIDGDFMYVEALGANSIISISSYVAGDGSTVVTFASSVDGNAFKVEYII